MKGVKVAKEQLKEWKDNGYSYQQIAEMTGLNKKTISTYMYKYGLTERNHISQGEVEKICRLKESGKSTRDIAEDTGRAPSTVYNILKAAGMIPGITSEDGLEENPGSILQPKRFAEYERAKSERFGKWIDITKLFMQECEQLAAYGDFNMLQD